MSDGGGVATGRSSARRNILIAVALAVALIAAAIWILRPNAKAPVAASPIVTTSAPTPTPTPTPAPTGPCSTEASGAFSPTKITVPGVVRDAAVLALPRNGRVTGTPPLSNAGKHEFAWDRPPGIRPGSSRGNVLLNAHTWPDGSALGNQLLKKLQLGDRIVVRNDDTSLCYRVKKRIEVPATSLVPAYYATDGPPQLAIIVCSGQRLGPENWTKRTIWYASPVS